MVLLDVTLRDGGFVNDFRLSEAAVRRTVTILDAAQVDAIEIGYLTGLPSGYGQFLDSQVCYALPLELIADLVTTTHAAIVAMLHPGATGKLDIPALAQTGLALVRVTINPGQEKQWRQFTDTLASHNIKFTLNLTAGSWHTTDVVVACAHLAQTSGAAAFYVADTNSAYLPQQVEQLYCRLREEIAIPLGFHAHDFKRLALANTFAALQGGATWIDGSAAGMGRGLGNAATEVLQEFLGVETSIRANLLRGLPAILHNFGVQRDEELWEKLGAFLDLLPPSLWLLEHKARERQFDKYCMTVDHVFGQTFTQPLAESLLDQWLMNVHQR